MFDKNRHNIYLRDTLIKSGDDKNYVGTKVALNPSRFHEATKNSILCKNLMFIFSLVPIFSRYCRSKNDHARLSYRISFMNTCSPYASVSAFWSKICTFLWPISVAIKCSASVSAPISSSDLNNVSLKPLASQLTSRQEKIFSCLIHIYLFFVVQFQWKTKF